MLDMTPSAAAARRLVLLPARSPRARPADPRVRRYRVAHLRLEGRDVSRSERFTHLKKSHD